MSRHGRGLAARLLIGQGVVLLAGVATAWLVALAVGPAIFHDHLRRAGTPSASEAAHAEEAFRTASAISLSVAVLAALAAALLVSVVVTRRVSRSVDGVARAARELTAGHYDTRVAPPGLGSEFDDLARAFNDMAGRLGSVEATRRRLQADVAHEMRTPVSTLGAYLEGLEDGVVALDAETIGVLRDQTGRLGRLAADMSAVSRAEEHQLDLDPQPTDPAELVDAALAAAADRYAAKGVAIVAGPREALPAVSMDWDRMGQVLGNLLDNALRHTPPGGTVTLSATADRAGVALTVADTGEGIEASHLPHVFERFYRADAARDRAHGGSGIGLAIAKAIVEAHDGRIDASSPGPGQGTTFTVRLPRS